MTTTAADGSSELANATDRGIDPLAESMSAEELSTQLASVAHGVEQGDTAVASRRTRDKDATPRGGRLVAWAGFVFGTVLSVAMNWLHTWLPADHMPDGWKPALAPQIMSAVWPVCLLLSVEVLSRVRWPDGATWLLARYGGVGTVAVGSAVISYGHVHDVLASWGYDAWGAAVGPLVMDGLMIACGFAMLSETNDRTIAPATTGAGHVPSSTEPVVERVSRTSNAIVASGDTAATGEDQEATASNSWAELDRDERIRAMHRAGASTREIGREIGLHYSTVARIVARDDDRNTQRDTRNTSSDLTLVAAAANEEEGL